MEQLLESITKEDEQRMAEIVILGKMFKQFITPFVEITLAVGKIDPEQMDPLLIISPKGLAMIAKTVREKGDGEGSVFFMTREVRSYITSYICMDFDQYFLKFCRSVRVNDKVLIHFDNDVYFKNITRIKEDKIYDLGSRPWTDWKWIYKTSANNLDDIKKEIKFSINLMKQTPKKWTARLMIPAREVKKFYVNVWRFLHRSVFVHKVKDNNALVTAYSEDAIRDLFTETWEQAGFDEPLFETPKRRFLMMRQFIDNEDGIECSGNGECVLRANWRIFKDIALSGLDFELNFKDFNTHYGIVVKGKDSMFMHIAENKTDNYNLIEHDIKLTLKNMITVPELKYKDEKKIA